METRKKRVLTGIKPTGIPHIGNYLGAIRPAIEMAKDPNFETYYFMANYHSLTTIHDAKILSDLTYSVTATWLALGLDPKQSVLFKQSDIPEIMEINWILSCFTSKGLMNRAHAYKAFVDANIAKGVDADNGINTGLYTYPVLMSADILSFQSDFVPVGADQVQHIEICRDIAKDFNSNYKKATKGKDLLKLPAAKVDENVAVVPGLDGRKMSKSYNNTIPMFLEEKALRKLIMKIVTDSSAPTEPKDPDKAFIFELYRHFASPEQIENMRTRFLSGIAWGDVKQELFVVMNDFMDEPRKRYNEFMSDKAEIDRILVEGSVKARAEASQLLKQIKSIIGV